MALQHIAQRIADQQGFNARRFQQRGKARVVAGEHGDLVTISAHLVNIGECDSHWGYIMN